MTTLSAKDSDYIAKIMILAQELPKGVTPDEYSYEQGYLLGFMQGLTTASRGATHGEDNR